MAENFCDTFGGFIIAASAVVISSTADPGRQDTEQQQRGLAWWRIHRSNNELPEVGFPTYRALKFVPKEEVHRDKHAAMSMAVCAVGDLVLDAAASCARYKETFIMARDVSAHNFFPERYHARHQSAPSSATTAAKAKHLSVTLKRKTRGEYQVAQTAHRKKMEAGQPAWVRNPAWKQ
jgi:hypothetical protein